MSSEAHILAFDPGKITGIAIFNQDGTLLGMEQLPLDSGDNNLLKWTAWYPYPVSLVIYEKFITFRQKAMQQVGSKQETAQAIGLIKGLAFRKQAELVEQKPDIKPIASKWSGVTVPSNHAISHQYDAYLHGFYLLHQRGIVKSKLEKEMGL